MWVHDVRDGMDMANKIWVLMYKGKPVTHFSNVIATLTKKQLVNLEGWGPLLGKGYHGYSIKKVEF